MIPIRDHVPTRTFPAVTVTLILVNVLVWLFQLLLSTSAGSLDAFVYTYGVVPFELTRSWSPGEALTLISSMFLHGGLLHLAGNMLYLWIFGNNVEDEMGWFGFTVFYLLCGILAGLAQVAAGPASRIPGIGASGAIAGVLGAYLVLYPHAKVDTLLVFGFFARLGQLPAVVVLGFWFVLQLFSGVASFGVNESGGVAWFAHIGGFVAGLVLVNVFVPRWRRAQIRAGM